MKQRFFDLNGCSMSRERYFAKRDRLYMQDRFRIWDRKNNGKDKHHVVSVEYIDDGLCFLVDKVIRGEETLFAYARTHARAYIHARHSH